MYSLCAAKYPQHAQHSTRRHQRCSLNRVEVVNRHVALPDTPGTVAALQLVLVGRADNLADILSRQPPDAVDIADGAGAITPVKADNVIGCKVVALLPGRPEDVDHRFADPLVPRERAEGGADIPHAVLP